MKESPENISSEIKIGILWDESKAHYYWRLPVCHYYVLSSPSCQYHRRCLRHVAGICVIAYWLPSQSCLWMDRYIQGDLTNMFLAVLTYLLHGAGYYLKSRLSLSLSRNILPTYGNRWFITVFTKAHHWTLYSAS
jgi:hypothetical protein